jgi:ribosomal protein S18 acetylase RimI-like enzyme
MPITIRRAIPTDLPTLGRLGVMLVRMHYEFDPRRFLAPRSGMEAGYASFLGSQMKSPDAVVLVAEEAGDVIGYTYSTVEGPDWMSLRGAAGVLQDIIVDPAHRGKGAGRLLLDATLAALKERGAPRVVLETADLNKGAQNVFERAGFRRTMVEMTRELDDLSS